MTVRMKKRSVGETIIWLPALLLAVLLASCAQGGSSTNIPTAGGNEESSLADTNPTPTVDPRDTALLYAQCIRENGYPEWPDPNPDGQFMLRRDQGMSMNDPRRLAAMEACQDLRPGGFGVGGIGGIQGFGSFDEETRFAFARCMRENGVPDFPDPSPGGGLVIGSGTGIDPNDPVFQDAVEICNESILGGGDQ